MGKTLKMTHFLAFFFDICRILLPLFNILLYNVFILSPLVHFKFGIISFDYNI